MLKKAVVRRIGLFLASGALSAGILVAFVVKPLQQASQARPCRDCAPPSRIPEPPGEEGQVKLGPARPGEWRQRFHEEPQSFDQYIAGPVNHKCPHRTTFYLQPLGAASTRYRELLERMRVHSEAYFGVPAKVLDPLPMFEETLERKRSQYDASLIIDRLAKRVPGDALVFIGITEKDLFSQGLNFVFGEASLMQRCGVYSLTRYETDDVALFTLRSLKLVSHESGHIFSIPHCVTYSCVMEGTNSLEEHDRQPLHLCPIDLRKVLWNSGVDRDERYRQLLELYKKWGLTAEAGWVRGRLGTH